jgi:hypothetical protein
MDTSYLRLVVVCVLGGFALACSDDAHVEQGAVDSGVGDPSRVPVPGEGLPGFLPPDSDEPCELNTKFEGDDSCIAPPKQGEGIQIHVGPKNYDDEEEVKPFLLAPGKEVTECYYTKTTNTDNEYYFPRKFRMRPGSHHLITNFIMEEQPEGWGPCTREGFGGSFNGAEKAKVDMPTSAADPAVKGYGKILPRNTYLKIELHHINTTEKPILREAWINVYWKPKAEIKTWVQDMFVLGGLSVAVPPGARQIYHNKCVMEGEAEIIDIYGHFHAHTTRFSAWRTRGEERLDFYEVYDWHDTPTFQYDRVTENPTPDPELLRAGGHSGVLDLKAGDVIEWECEVDNTSEVTLRYSNELETGEMCNLFGTYHGHGKTLTTCRDFGKVTNL